MIVFDTDHVSAVQNPTGARGRRLMTRLAAVRGAKVAVAIASVEEQMRGWLASIAKERHVARQVPAYRELRDLFAFFGAFIILPFDDAAAVVFDTFDSVRIGTMDKKIAAIALANGALLLTANRRDFEKIPGLTIDNWMD